jgi:hypothetical protein
MGSFSLKRVIWIHALETRLEPLDRVERSVGMDQPLDHTHVRWMTEVAVVERSVFEVRSERWRNVHMASEPGGQINAR